MKFISCLLLVMFLGACGNIKQSDKQGPAKKTYPAGVHIISFKNAAINDYVVLLPENYSPTKTYPVIFAFHGSVGNAKIAYRRWAGASKDFILVCPNGTARMGWQLGVGQLDQILACLDDAIERFSIDTDRVYLTGHSMGGYVTWNLSIFHRERFTAVAPTASAPQYFDRLDSVLTLPIYVVHGRNDGIVSLSGNQKAEQYINANGGSMTLVVIENQGHGFVKAQQAKIIDFFNKHK